MARRNNNNDVIEYIPSFDEMSGGNGGGGFNQDGSVWMPKFIGSPLFFILMPIFWYVLYRMVGKHFGEHGDIAQGVYVGVTVVIAMFWVGWLMFYFSALLFRKIGEVFVWFQKSNDDGAYNRQRGTADVVHAFNAQAKYQSQLAVVNARRKQQEEKLLLDLRKEDEKQRIRLDYAEQKRQLRQSEPEVPSWMDDDDMGDTGGDAFRYVE